MLGFGERGLFWDSQVKARMIMGEGAGKIKHTTASGLCAGGQRDGGGLL